MMDPAAYEDLPWENVESSNLRRVAFVGTPQPESVAEEMEPAQQPGTLYVEFHDGRAYRYLEVHRETYEELLEAESVGAYFAREVRPHHQFEKVER